MKEDGLKRMYELYVSNKLRKEHEDIQSEQIVANMKKKNKRRGK
jgi:hypothetical protein